MSDSDMLTSLVTGFACLVLVVAVGFPLHRFLAAADNFLRCASDIGFLAILHSSQELLDLIGCFSSGCNVTPKPMLRQHQGGYFHKVFAGHLCPSGFV